jgi:Helix-turn-helix domain
MTAWTITLFSQRVDAWFRVGTASSPRQVVPLSRFDGRPSRHSHRLRIGRRAPLERLVFLDDGWNCQEVAHAFLLDDDMIRGWREHFEQRGIEGLPG